MADGAARIAGPGYGFPVPALPVLTHQHLAVLALNEKHPLTTDGAFGVR